MREVLESIERKTGKRTPEHAALDLDLPEQGRYLWEWFGDLSGTRSSGMAPNPLSYLEIESWARLMRCYPAPWEVAAIKAIDAVFLKSMAEEQ